MLVTINKSSLKALLDSTILQTLVSQPLLGYREIAALYEVSTDYIVDIARKNNVGRPLGRKPGVSNKKASEVY
jgi:hypothetical protein